MRFTIVYYDGNRTDVAIVDADGPYGIEDKFSHVLDRSFEHIEAVHEIPDNCRPYLENRDLVEDGSEPPAIMLDTDEGMEGGADEGRVYIPLFDIRTIQEA